LKISIDLDKINKSILINTLFRNTLFYKEVKPMIPKNHVITILEELGFDDSDKEREFILSIIDKINKNLREFESKLKEGIVSEIRISLTKEEISAIWQYDLEPPRINALYAIIDLYFSQFNFRPYITTEGNWLVIMDEKLREKKESTLH